MTRPLLFCVALSALLLARQDESSPARAAGHLVVVGGGGTPEVVVQRALELAGERPNVVVIPHASEVEGRGEASAEMWRKAGARRVTLIDRSPKLGDAKARAAIARANLVWFPGGAQSRLISALEEAKLLDLVAERYLAGAVVGGTSAGAAVMSQVMISGPPEPAAYHVGAMRALQGLGLWTEVIVDQHFIGRGRNNRLLTAVLDHPGLLGVGISERTAAIVDAEGFDVLGDGHVVVYDARKAEIEERDEGEPRSARGVVMHVLRSGQRYEAD